MKPFSVLGLLCVVLVYRRYACETSKESRLLVGGVLFFS